MNRKKPTKKYYSGNNIIHEEKKIICGRRNSTMTLTRHVYISLQENWTISTIISFACSFQSVVERRIVIFVVGYREYVNDAEIFLYILKNSHCASFAIT